MITVFHLLIFVSLPQEHPVPQRSGKFLLFCNGKAGISRGGFFSVSSIVDGLMPLSFPVSYINAVNFQPRSIPGVPTEKQRFCGRGYQGFRSGK